MPVTEQLPIEWDPRLDRRQSSPPGCFRFLFLVPLLVAALGAVVLIAMNQSQPPAQVIPTVAELPTLPAFVVVGAIASPELIPPSQPPTASRTPSPTGTITPDSWGMTGTALARATASPTHTATEPVNYCWWLTPSPTPTPTLETTPDAWGRTGTAIYRATYPFQTPTAPPPRELCYEFPTWTPTARFTPSLTPFPLGRSRESTEEVTEEVYGTPPITLPFILPPATWTPAPVQPPAQVIDRPQVEVVITAPPPEPIVITSPPIIIIEPTQPPQVVVITATLAPTNTPTWTWTPTDTATATPTETPSPTATATDTPSPTPTPTDTATSEA